ncbi:MAG TPA: PEP-CTERM sorting domain-containing protein [Phycisphaerae bacterium]|nr:PEP-CTERM sorting domain-containing protein [Phycisphaerae bacterium]
MFVSRKLPVVPAALLALAVAQASSAAVISSSLVTPGTINGNTYTSVGMTYVNGAGYAVGTTAAANAAQLLWVYNPTTSSTSFIGFQSTDAPAYVGSGGSTNTVNNIPNPNDPADVISSNGYVLGSTSRYGYKTTTTTGWNAIGTDAWVAAPSTAAGATGIVTPTLVAPTTTLTDSNGLTSSYFFTTSDVNTNSTSGINQTYRNSTAYGVNASGQVIGYANRYSGGTTTLSNSTASGIGTDVWISTPGSNGTYTSTPLGLGVSNSATGYAGTKAFNSTNYTYRTSSLILGKLPNSTSINDSGVVVGMTTRYVPTSTSTLGTDAWMYNYNGSGQTYQIGATGGVYSYTSGSNTTQSTALLQFNPSSQVAGTSNRYGSSTTPTGMDAWIYTPNGTPTTTTSLGSGNGYVQVGLTDASTSTSIGHAYTDSSSYLHQTSTIIALNNSGQAAGTSTRYTSTGTNRGSDAWYDSGSGSSVNLNPYAGAVTVTVNGGANSNYLSSVGGITQNVVTMNSHGLVAGHLTGTYDSNNVNLGGQAGYVYDPSNNTEYVLTAPTVSSIDDFGKVQVMALSDSGVAVGYYQTGNVTRTLETDGTITTTVTPNADFLFAWSEGTGLVTVDQLNTISVSQVATPYPGLNTLLAGQSGWAALANSISGLSITAPLLATDVNGNIYGLGNTSSTATTTNGVFEITGVPEPASLGLIGVGSLLLLRRRKA